MGPLTALRSKTGAQHVGRTEATATAGSTLFSWKEPWLSSVTITLFRDDPREHLDSMI
jgi:hypothetical protein